jgi:hypothetical protein
LAGCASSAKPAADQSKPIVNNAFQLALTMMRLPIVVEGLTTSFESFNEYYYSLLNSDRNGHEFRLPVSRK